MTLTVQSCTFNYPRREPLFIDLDVGFRRGKTVLLGPNGAGKSTLLALCAGALRTRRGGVSLDRLPANAREYRRRVAWLPQTVAAFPALTVREQVVYSGWLKGMSARSARIAADRALEEVRLAPMRNKKARELSGGQLRRLGIAGALIHDADAILLDEPYAGLDPSQRETLSAVIADISSEKILVVSTHQTDDFTDLYDHAVVLAAGTILFDGPSSDFLGRGTGSDPARSAYLSYVGAEA